MGLAPAVSCACEQGHTSSPRKFVHPARLKHIFKAKNMLNGARNKWFHLTISSNNLHRENPQIINQPMIQTTPQWAPLHLLKNGALGNKQDAGLAVIQDVLDVVRLLLLIHGHKRRPEAIRRVRSCCPLGPSI